MRQLLQEYYSSWIEILNGGFELLTLIPFRKRSITDSFSSKNMQTRAFQQTAITMEKLADHSASPYLQSSNRLQHADQPLLRYRQVHRPRINLSCKEIIVFYKFSKLGGIPCGVRITFSSSHSPLRYLLTTDDSSQTKLMKMKDKEVILGKISKVRSCLAKDTKLVT